jgi:uracil-DNA glycosylase family 4
VGKKQALEKIAEEVKNCKKCPLWKKATNPVPGEGNPKARIMLIGEAPGYWEDQKGRPFVGPAGKLLDQLIESIGLKRTGVFITNMLKHRPPGNRDPQPEEIAACKAWLDEQIAIIRPKIIVTLGRFSMYKFIPNGKISQIHGQSHVVNWQGRGIIVFPMFHPAAALRNANILEETRRDFKKVPHFLTTEIESLIEKKTEEGMKKEKEEQLVLAI